jgi:hypothetical protein
MFVNKNLSTIGTLSAGKWQLDGATVENIVLSGYT